MKKILKINTLSMLMVIVGLSNSLQAGVSTSGGGYAVVCRNSDKSIATAELLDLFEGRLKYNLNIQQSTGITLKDYIQSANNTYYLQSGGDFVVPDAESEEIFNRFMNRVVWLSDKEEISPKYDLGSVSEVLNKIKQGCDIEQMALFEDMIEKVSVVQEIWNHLDSMSQAALVQHELWYRQYRQLILFPESTSQNIRLNVAMIFSTGLLSATDGVPKNEIPNTAFHDLNANETGHWDKTSFYNFSLGIKNQKGYEIWRKQFSEIAGRPVLSKTYIDVPEKINFYDIYPIQGLQFKDWTLRMVPDSKSGSGVKMQILNENNLIVTEILQ